MSGSTRQGIRLPTIAGTGLDSNGLKAIRRAAPFLIGLSALTTFRLVAEALLETLGKVRGSIA